MLTLDTSGVGTEDDVPPFTPEAPLEDWWLMLQISKISKIYAIDDFTYSYRWHQSNTIKQIEHVHDMAIIFTITD